MKRYIILNWILCAIILIVRKNKRTVSLNEVLSKNNKIIISNLYEIKVQECLQINEFYNRFNLLVCVKDQTNHH